MLELDLQRQRVGVVPDNLVALARQHVGHPQLRRQRREPVRRREGLALPRNGHVHAGKHAAAYVCNQPRHVGFIDGIASYYSAWEAWH